MALALEQFVKQLEDSGVIAAGKLERFIPPNASPKDARELARQLILSKQLTKFQVQEIYQGRAKSLILGNYTILDKIGAGGMGQVFKAEHRRMHRTVAIKILPRSEVKSTSGIARFLREAEAAARLTHPNIVAAYDADEANDIHFLVMEYVEGSDLSALVKKDGPLSVRKAVNYVLQAARGLEFAHGEHVVHRDIKPANLLLDKKGTVKILDMGLARVEMGHGAAAQADLTGSGAVIGTVDYMAPEQGVSTKKAGARADIYSLGCTLHYLLTGKPVYDGDTVTAKLLAHHQQPVPDLCKLNDDVPEPLQSIFSQMVAKRIEDRFQTMSEVVGALEAFEASTSGLQNSASVLDSVDTSMEAEALSFLGDISKVSASKSRIATNKVRASTPDSAPEPPPVVGSDLIPEERVRDNKKLFSGMVAAGLVLATVAVLLALPKTTTGTLTVRIDQPNVVVQVLSQDGNVEVNESGVDGKLSIAVHSGKHRLSVEKKGFQTFTQDFVMESGADQSIKVTLERILEASAPINPAAEQWAKEVADLPAEKQVEAVVKKLQEVNSGFDGKETHRIENGVVAELQVNSDQLTDISPVRALAGLRLLSCGGTNDGNYRNGHVGDLSPLRGMQLTTLLIPSTPVRDLAPLAGMPLKNLNCAVTSVANLWPLRGMDLTDLDCGSSYVSDLSPLRGMPLARLDCGETNVTDLSPLQGMHLTSLGCANTEVADLAPLKGMRLTILGCSCTKVADLSPLEGMPVTELYCDATRVSDLSSLRGMNLRKLVFTPKNITKGFEVIRRMKSLEKIGIAHDQEPLAANEFWKKFDTGEFNPFDTNPASKRWMKDVVALPAEQQVKAVVAKLREINPQYAGQESHKIENGVVTALTFPSDFVTDLLPVRALGGLKVLNCSSGGRSALSDMSPLKGLPLVELDCWNTQVRDLSPLHGMPLETLNLYSTPVSNLTPLEGMKLVSMTCNSTRVTDLSPLKGMPITSFDCNTTQVSDLSPLQGMKLTKLNIVGTQVTSIAALKGAPLTSFSCNSMQVADLTPLKGMLLTDFDCNASKVFDLSPLKGMPLTTVRCNGTQVADLSPLQGMKLTLLDCGNTRVADFSPLKGMRLTELICYSTLVADLSPLKGMPLTTLRCNWTQVSDLSPLKGMPLKVLDVGGARVSDLAPIEHMKLTFLSCCQNPVFDLSPLRGMPLATLYCDNTLVSDLSPLEGMKLTSLWITPKNISKGMPIVRRMKSLQLIGLGNLREQCPPDQFWTKYDAGEFNAWDTNPIFKKWVKDVGAMSAENQMAAVVAKLINFNAGFDGRETPKIENGVVTELHFSSDHVFDISPLRALVGLRALYCGGGSPGSGMLFDLSPLRGMPLTGLKCSWSQVSDLSPLEGMRLTYLDCGGTQVRDLSPLRGMPLTGLWCGGTQVSDLSPLAGMPLANLYCDTTQVSDLSPLNGMNLAVVTFTPKNIAKGIDVIRQMKSLDRIGIGWQPQEIFPADEFWKKFDAGEFKQ